MAIAGGSLNFGVQVNPDDLKRINKKMATIGWKLADNREWMKQAGDKVVYPRISEVFQSQGKPKWRGLSPNYIKPAGLPILVLSGKLRASLLNKGTEGSHYVLKKDRLEVGTKLQTKSGRGLGMLHQEGTNKMPKREIFSFMTVRNVFDESMAVFRDHVKKIHKDFWATRTPPFGGK